MIDGLVRILVFQGIGEVVGHFVFPLVPGPVIGLA
ncbi:MAG: CidA/LrgA family protein, partial [Betaproteobacteria bacterium]|nr:CidA/LrgA family protein [Betaproteobacteria bacterium]